MTIKTYTPEEAAILVLKKAEELYKNSKLSKSNTSHEVENGEEASNDEAECPEYLASADIESGSSTGKHGEAKSSESDMEYSEEESEEDKDKKKKEVPEHEGGLGEEEKEIHDETESESDEEEIVSDKKVESQEKDEVDSDKIEDKEEGKKEEKKEDKKFPFQKAEKLNSFMKKMELKKKFKINKNAKIEKFLGTDKKVIKPTESMAPKQPSIPQPKGNESGDKPMHKPALAPVADKLKPKAGY